MTTLKEVCLTWYPHLFNIPDNRYLAIGEASVSILDENFEVEQFVSLPIHRSNCVVNFNSSSPTVEIVAPDLKSTFDITNITNIRQDVVHDSRIHQVNFVIQIDGKAVYGTEKGLFTLNETFEPYDSPFKNCSRLLSEENKGFIITGIVNEGNKPISGTYFYDGKTVKMVGPFLEFQSAHATLDNRYVLVKWTDLEIIDAKNYKVLYTELLPVGFISSKTSCIANNNLIIADSYNKGILVKPLQHLVNTKTIFGFNF